MQSDTRIEGVRNDVRLERPDPQRRQRPGKQPGKDRPAPPRRPKPQPPSESADQDGHLDSLA